jgi:hypothetical protein
MAPGLTYLICSTCEAGFTNCGPAMLTTPAGADVVANIIPAPTIAATFNRVI